MKIAQVVCSFPPYPGGMGQSAWRLGEILEREYQVTTFTLNNPSQKPPIASQQTVIYLQPWLRLGHGALTFSLLWRLRKFKVIYLHYPFFGASEIIYLLLCLFPEKKLIIHYHMDTPQLLGIKKFLAKFSKLIEKKLLAKADKILVSSLDYAQHGKLADYIKKTPAKIKELPFAIDTETFKPRFNDNKQSPLWQRASEFVRQITRRIIKQGGHQLLFIGGLDQAHYFKGLEVLMQALSTLTDNYWKLDIIGDGDRRPYYQVLSQKYKIDQRVYFRGRLSDDELIRYYQNADILILPSINTHEAFGLVLIEALACGVPVIASDLPGVRGVFTDGQEGLRVSPGDAQDLREKITYLLNNEEKRRQMANASRQLALKRYDNKTISDKLLDEFSDLIS